MWGWGFSQCWSTLWSLHHPWVGVTLYIPHKGDQSTLHLLHHTLIYMPLITVYMVTHQFLKTMAEYRHDYLADFVLVDSTEILHYRIQKIKRRQLPICPSLEEENSTNQTFVFPWTTHCFYWSLSSFHLWQKNNNVRKKLCNSLAGTRARVSLACLWRLSNHNLHQRQ